MTQRRGAERLGAVLGLAAITVLGCGSTTPQVPTYTQSKNFPPAAQIYPRAQAELRRALPVTYACATFPGPHAVDEKLRIIVTDPASTDTAKQVIDRLGGMDFVEFATTDATNQDGARQRLLKRLRASAPDVVTVNEGTVVSRATCPIIEVNVPPSATDASVESWARSVAHRYGARVKVTRTEVTAATAG
jgi:hypothetical protein